MNMKGVGLRVGVLILSGMSLVCLNSAGQETKAEVAAGQEAGPANPVEFSFGGGRLHEFIRRIDSAFGVKLGEVGEIPASMLEVRVPKLRMRAWRYHDVLRLYNELSDQMPENGLGKWIVKEAMTEGRADYTRPPQVLILAEAKQPGSGDVKARAFPFQASSGKLEQVQKIVDEQWIILMERNPGTQVNGTIRYHPEAGILVATGTQLYTELVSEVMGAFEANKAKEKNEVVVVGQVNKVGGVTLPEDQALSILEALGRAGGLTARGNQNKIVFKRPGELQRVFSLQELKTQTNNIIYLKPGDMIEVQDKLF